MCGGPTQVRGGSSRLLQVRTESPCSCAWLERSVVPVVRLPRPAKHMHTRVCAVLGAMSGGVAPSFARWRVPPLNWAYLRRLVRLQKDLLNSFLVRLRVEKMRGGARGDGPRDCN